MNDLLKAVSLLTIAPVRPRWDDGAPLGRAMAAYPLVGLGIGGALAVWAWSLGWLMAGNEALAGTRAALIVIAWVALSGGLHLDGWGDACDGLLSAVDRERRLEILRDPRMGSFGVIGIALLLLLKTATVSAVHGGAPLALVPMLGRWSVVLAAYRWPSARPGGMGDRFRQGLGRQQVALASLTVAVVAALALLLDLIAPVALAAALFVTLAGTEILARFAAGRLGGLTGDIYGAIVEGVEASVLLALAWLG